MAWEPTAACQCETAPHVAFPAKALRAHGVVGGGHLGREEGARGREVAGIARRAPKPTRHLTPMYPAPTRNEYAAGKKAKKLTFTIDCSKPVEDKIMDMASFETFLQERIKVDGKAGVLGDVVTVARDKSKVNVTSDTPMSKVRSVPLSLQMQSAPLRTPYLTHPSLTRSAT